MEEVEERNKQKAEEIQRKLGELGHQLEEKRSISVSWRQNEVAYKKSLQMNKEYSLLLKES